MPPDLNPQRSGLLALHQAATVHFIKTPKPILFPFKWAVNGECSQKEAAESKRQREANDNVGPRAPHSLQWLWPRPVRGLGGPCGKAELRTDVALCKLPATPSAGRGSERQGPRKLHFNETRASTAAGSLWALESELCSHLPLHGPTCPPGAGE